MQLTKTVKITEIKSKIILETMNGNGKDIIESILNNY